MVIYDYIKLRRCTNKETTLILFITNSTTPMTIETYNLEWQTYCEINVDESEILETKDWSYVFTWFDSVMSTSLYEMLYQDLLPIPNSILVVKQWEFRDEYKVRELEITQLSAHDFILKFIRH